ncbi:MAG: nuclear transport factor 2 family protein [Myxococcales bacterium]|nr:nuclear transport factor 2 family protein [Myxococcales bacterium]
MATLNLEQQIARLAAIEDIKQLKARYCAFCDDQYDPEGISGLFVEEGIWDGGPDFGRHEGREAIRTFFRGASGMIVFAAHLVMNPVIEVTGGTATGKWRLIMPCTMKDDAGKPEARWLLSSYDDSYVERDGRWLFKQLKVENQFLAAHETGWAAQTAAS